VTVAITEVASIEPVSATVVPPAVVGVALPDESASLDESAG
jgi:hypothetical protein